MDFKERQRKYELQTDQDGNRKMEKKFQADKKKEDNKIEIQQKCIWK